MAPSANSHVPLNGATDYARFVQSQSQLAEDERRALYRAWEIYAAADNIMHSRIQSFLMTQAFLVASFVTATTVNLTVDRGATWFVAAVICVLSLGLTIVFQSKNKSVLMKMIYFVQHILPNEPAWRFFMGAQPSGRRKRNAYIELAPRFFIAFWIACLGHLSPSVGR